MVKARLPRSTAVFVLPKARQGDDHHIPPPWLRADALACRKTVDPRHADVQEHGIWTKSLYCSYRFEPVAYDFYLMA